MADVVFKWRHFAPELILVCVRWYCRCAISYRDLEEMMADRGVAVDHTTLYRWIQRYAPELEKRTIWHQNRFCHSWRVDESRSRSAQHGEVALAVQVLNRMIREAKPVSVRR